MKKIAIIKDSTGTIKEILLTDGNKTIDLTETGMVLKITREVHPQHTKCDISFLVDEYQERTVL